MNARLEDKATGPRVELLSGNRTDTNEILSEISIGSAIEERGGRERGR